MANESLISALEALRNDDPLPNSPSELLGQAKDELKDARDMGDLQAGVLAMEIIVSPQVRQNSDGSSPINEAFAQALGWYFYKLISPNFDQPDEFKPWLPELKTIFKQLPSLPYPKPDALHSCFLRALLDKLPLKDEERYQLLIVQDFEALTEEEFNPFGNYNVIFADKLFNFLLKHTVSTAKKSPQDVDYIFWIGRAQHWNEKLPTSKFIVYYLTFLFHYAGYSLADIRPHLRRFLQKGLQDGWRWAKAAEVFKQEEPKRAMQCYIRALDLTKEDKISISWRWQLLWLLQEYNFLNLGHDEEREITVFLQKHQLTCKPWQQNLLYNIRQTTRNSKTKEFYQRAREKADEFLYDDLPKKTAIVIRVQYKGYNLIFEGDDNGYIPKHLVKEDLQELDFVEAYASKNSDKWKLHAVQKIDQPQETQLIKNVTGELQIKGNDIGFVQDVFVPATLIDGHALSNGDHVEVVAVRQYDKKKERWGYAAKQIQPVTQ